jgi:DUF1365 family protein
MVPQLVVARALQVEELTATRALQVEELTTAHVLQAEIAYPPLGTVLGTMHIHSNHPAAVIGWAKIQILWRNAHNI